MKETVFNFSQKCLVNCGTYGYAKVSNCLYVFLCIISMVVMVDPSNTIFMAKEILFICVLVLFLPISRFCFSKKMIGFVIFLFAVPCSFSMLRGIFSEKINFDYALMTIRYFSYSLIIFPLSYFTSKNILKMFRIACMSLVVSYSVVWLYALFPGNSIIDFCGAILRTGEFTTRSGDVIPLIEIYGIFYLTSPVLLLFYGYLIFRQDSCRILLPVLVALLVIFSGTQANQFSILLITCFRIVCALFGNLSSLKQFLIFVIVGILVFILSIPILFDKSDGGVSIKGKDAIGYCELWDESPFDFVFGMGLGTSFRSLGRNKEVFVTELMWFEFLRRHGFIVTFVFFAYLFYPIKIFLVKPNCNGILIGYLAYLFVAGTNPLLISSTGFFVITFVWAYSTSKSRQTIKWSNSGKCKTTFA